MIFMNFYKIYKHSLKHKEDKIYFRVYIYPTPLPRTGCNTKSVFLS